MQTTMENEFVLAEGKNLSSTLVRAVCFLRWRVRFMCLTAWQGSDSIRFLWILRFWFRSFSTSTACEHLAALTSCYS